MKKIWIIILSGLVFMTACEKKSLETPSLDEAPAGAQAVSLLGKPLFTLTPSEKSMEQLDQARIAYQADPDDPDNLIWLGRRTAYTGDYREAVKIYTEGIEKFPEDPRLYRHRGHRHISLREFDRAVEDLEMAALLIAGTEDTVEPDGLPNALNIPVSTLHTNIWYHLGLAYYLENDLQSALGAYQKGITASTNDDMLAAMLHWVYMSLRLLGRDEEAIGALGPVHEDMTVIENTAYYRLCLLYKGIISEEEIAGEDFSDIMNDALAYGVGNWNFYNGKREQAREIFQGIIEKGIWASFGHIAAEAQLAREYRESGPQ